MEVPNSVVGIPDNIPDGQTLGFDSKTGEIVGIHDSSIENDIICEVVCGKCLHKLSLVLQHLKVCIDTGDDANTPTTTTTTIPTTTTTTPTTTTTTPATSFVSGKCEKGWTELLDGTCIL